MLPADQVPREMLDLRDQAGSALIVLRVILPTGERFEEYYSALLSLAQLGLVGLNANPDAAARALAELKQDVVAREAGRIKNEYMRSLGIVCGCFGSALLFAVWLLVVVNPAAVEVRRLLVYEVGTCLGVWLSFGTRKPILNFEDLHILEDDRLEPAVRLIFAGLLAFVLALAFHLRVITVTLGSLTTEAIDTNIYAALFIGLLAGVSEKTLSTQVTKQASALLKPS